MPEAHVGQETQKVKVSIRPPHGWVAKFRRPDLAVADYKEKYFFPEFDVTVTVLAGLDDEEFGTAVVSAVEEIIKTGALPTE